MYKNCISGTYDLLAFRVILEPFGALVSKWPLTRKWLAVEQNGVKFETRGVVVTYIWDAFDLLVFKVILGSFDAMAFKGPVTRKCLAVEGNGAKFGTL